MILSLILIFFIALVVIYVFAPLIDFEQYKEVEYSDVFYKEIDDIDYEGLTIDKK